MTTEMSHPVEYHFHAPLDAPNVRFINAEVKAQAARQEYSRHLISLFNISVELLLLVKNAGLTRVTSQEINELLEEAQQASERLAICASSAKDVQTSRNVFRYLNYLLNKGKTQPTFDVFYEMTCLAEALAEGFKALRAG